LPLDIGRSTIPELGNVTRCIEDSGRVATDRLTLMTERESDGISAVRLEIMAGVAGDLSAGRELGVEEESTTKVKNNGRGLLAVTEKIRRDGLKCCETRWVDRHSFRDLQVDRLVGLLVAAASDE
jgi:hypothetical protein